LKITHHVHIFHKIVYYFSKEKLPHVLIPPKILELERERALKWGKMLRNWEKFQGSDVVSTSIICIYVKFMFKSGLCWSVANIRFFSTLAVFLEITLMPVCMRVCVRLRGHR